jgi:hypothetical protein
MKDEVTQRKISGNPEIIDDKLVEESSSRGSWLVQIARYARKKVRQKGELEPGSECKPIV